MENFQEEYEGTFNVALYFHVQTDNVTLVYSWVLSGVSNSLGWKKRDAGRNYQILFGNFEAQSIQCLWHHLLNGETLLISASKAEVPIEIKLTKLIADWRFPAKNYIRRPQCVYRAKDEWDADCDEFYSPTKSSIAKVESFFCLNKSEFLADENIYLKHCEFLREETGIDFSKKQAGRLGNVEWYEFPSSNIYDRPDISIAIVAGEGERKISGRTVRVTFNPDTAGHYLINVRCSNGAAIVCDTVKDIHVSQPLQYADFLASEEISSTRVKVWKRINGSWDFFHEKQFHLIRSLHSRMAVSSGSAIVDSKKLNRAATAQKVSIEKIELLKKVSFYNKDSISIISEDQYDPWRSITIDFPKKIERYHPAKSDSMFLPKGWDGTIKFYDWLRSIPKKIESINELIIIDPHVDEEVLRLVPRFGNTHIAYTIITNTAVSKNPADRQEALKQAAEFLYSKIKSFNVKIYDVIKSKRLIHDRYILLKNSDGLFEKGWNLSNSIQKANENFPLLITVIPQDTLYDIQDWLSNTLNSGTELRVIWDSSNTANSMRVNQHHIYSSEYEDLSVQEITDSLPGGWARICANGYNNNVTADNIVLATQEISPEIWGTIGNDIFEKVASGYYDAGDMVDAVVDIDWLESKKFSENLDYADRLFNYLPSSYHTPPSIHFLISAAMKNNEVFLLEISEKIMAAASSSKGSTQCYQRYFHKFFSSLIFEFMLSDKDEGNYLKSNIDLVVGLAACSLSKKISETVITPEAAVTKISSVSNENSFEILLKWIHTLRILDNRQNAGVEERIAIRQVFFQKLSEIWPRDSSSEQIKYVLLRCGGPGRGNWAGSTTNELFLPLLGSGKISIGNFWAAAKDLTFSHLEDKYFSETEANNIFEVFGWASSKLDSALLEEYLLEMDKDLARDIRNVEKPFSVSISYENFSTSLDRLHKHLLIFSCITKYKALGLVDKRTSEIFEKLQKTKFLMSTSSLELNKLVGSRLNI